MSEGYQIWDTNCPFHGQLSTCFILDGGSFKWDGWMVGLNHRVVASGITFNLKTPLMVWPREKFSNLQQWNDWLENWGQMGYQRVRTEHGVKASVWGACCLHENDALALTSHESGENGSWMQMVFRPVCRVRIHDSGKLKFVPTWAPLRTRAMWTLSSRR